ncbi:MAG: hypothetical protein JRI75_11085, partial [Deltaproteobacteria bacterium]|nr:hypothetical protein [Deltaproteobacteria bacterium]
MTFNTIKTSSKKLYLRLLLSLGLVFILLIAGCSSFSKIKEKTLDITSDIKISKNSDFTKKMGVAVFENKTNFSDGDFQDRFQIHLLETLRKECPEILLLAPGDAEYPEDLIELPRRISGQVDNLALAKAGRQSGLNAVVTGVIIDIRGKEEERGFWWFKEPERFTRVQIVAEVYDAETGSKIIDESFIHEIEMDGLEGESTASAKEIDVAAVNDAIMHIGTEMGESICKTVGDQPWRGFIVSVAENKIILSQGEKAGLKLGDIL